MLYEVITGKRGGAFAIRMCQELIGHRRDQAVLGDPATAHTDIARVLRSALERSLPVYIEFPRDMVDARVEPVPVLPQRAADPDALARNNFV